MENYAQIAFDKFGLEQDTEYLDNEQVELLSMAAGDAGNAFFEDLIETFKNECTPRLERLGDAIAEKSLEEIKRHIHFIAGSAANIGLSRLSRLCRKIEEQCDENTFSAFDQCRQVVSSEVEISLVKIREQLAMTH